jgi:hypothetical protein
MALTFLVAIFTKYLSFEVEAYKTFFTYRQGKNFRSINYDDIDSVKFTKLMTGSKIDFYLKDTANTSPSVENTLKFKKDKDSDHITIPVEEVQKFKLFKQIIIEKIEPERIDWGK